jgi:hypothetical protein
MKLPCAARWFESIFGDENSESKRWVRRLYDLGLIPRIPSMCEAPETPDFVCVPPSRVSTRRGQNFGKLISDYVCGDFLAISSSRPAS